MSVGQSAGHDIFIGMCSAVTKCVNSCDLPEELKKKGKDLVIFNIACHALIALACFLGAVILGKTGVSAALILGGLYSAHVLLFHFFIYNALPILERIFMSINNQVSTNRGMVNSSTSGRRDPHLDPMPEVTTRSAPFSNSTSSSYSSSSSSSSSSMRYAGDGDSSVFSDSQYGY